MVHSDSPNAVWFSKQGLTERLTELHHSGCGYTSIAKTLAEEFRIKLTRNACIGKARRLALPTRKRTEPAPRKPRKSRAKPANERISYDRFAQKFSKPLPLLLTTPITPLKPKSELPRDALRVANLPVLALQRGECRFPCDGEYPYQFCGRPQIEGSRYCLGHFHLSRKVRQ
jgi:GcrA cell cycle regulator